jgi:hypothetical protein
MKKDGRYSSAVGHELVLRASRRNIRIYSHRDRFLAIV